MKKIDPNDSISSVTLPKNLSYEEYENFKLQQYDLVLKAVEAIIQKHKLPKAKLTQLEGSNIVFAYEENENQPSEERIIKIYPPIHTDHYISENLVLKALQGKLRIQTPVLEFEGKISGWPYVVMSKIKGTSLEGLWESLPHTNKIILIRELGLLIQEVHSLSTHGLEAIDCHWPDFIKQQINHCVSNHEEKHLPDYLIKQIPDFIGSIRNELEKIEKPVLLTGEYTPMNLIVKQKNGIWHIEGLIDFGDSMLGLSEYDLLGPICFLIQGDKILLRELLNSFGFQLERYSASELNNLSHKLTALMLLHRYSNLEVQIRIQDWKNKVKSLDELKALVLGLT